MCARLLRRRARGPTPSRCGLKHRAVAYFWGALKAPQKWCGGASPGRTARPARAACPCEKASRDREDTSGTAACVHAQFTATAATVTFGRAAASGAPHHTTLVTPGRSARGTHVSCSGGGGWLLCCGGGANPLAHGVAGTRSRGHSCIRGRGCMPDSRRVRGPQHGGRAAASAGRPSAGARRPRSERVRGARGGQMWGATAQPGGVWSRFRFKQ